MTSVGIVGSRKRFERERIKALLTNLKEQYGASLTIVSGGAVGIDTTARNVSKELGIKFEEYLPNMEGARSYWDAVRRYYERNELIAEHSDYLYAFPINRKGGTMNTVKHFIKCYGEDRLTIID